MSRNPGGSGHTRNRATLRGASVPPASSLMTHLMTHFPVTYIRGSNNEAQVTLFSCQLHSPVSLHVSTTPVSSKHVQSYLSPDKACPHPSHPNPYAQHPEDHRFLPHFSTFPARIQELGFHFFFHREWDEGKTFSKAKEKEETGSPHILIFSDSNFLRRPSFAISVKTGMVRFTSKSY